VRLLPLRVMLEMAANLVEKCSLVELERPTAFNSSALFPSHTLRYVYPSYPEDIKY
jgi:hypothetical protein